MRVQLHDLEHVGQNSGLSAKFKAKNLSCNIPRELKIVLGDTKGHGPRTDNADVRESQIVLCHALTAFAFARIVDSPFTCICLCSRSVLLQLSMQSGRFLHLLFRKFVGNDVALCADVCHHCR
jgi:hypothetical protein